MERETPLSIRQFDRALWREVRAAATAIGVPGGELLSQIVRDWLEAKRLRAERQMRRRLQREDGESS